MSGRSRLRYGVAAAALTVLGGAAAMAAQAEGQGAAGGRFAGQEIRLGAIVPSSGPFAEWGKTNTIVLKMIEDKVNAAGGIEGGRLRIVVYDDGAKPAQAANLERKLGTDDKVLAIAGPLTSSACEVAFPVANQEKVVSTSQASSKPGVAAANRPWAFRDTVDESIFAASSVAFFKKTYGVKSVAVIYDAKDATSTVIATRIMPPAMKRDGIAVLNEASPVSFSTGDIDVSAQVTALKGLDPDGVVIGADYSQAVTVIREMRRQGFVKPVIGGTPLISSAILKASPDLPIVAPATYYPGMTEPKAEAFTREVQPLFKAAGLAAGVEPSMFDANIAEIMGMYIQAIGKAGVTNRPADLASDRERIRDYMTHLTGYEGLIGPVSFNEHGDAIKTYFIVLGQGGKWKEVVRACSVPGKC